MIPGTIFSFVPLLSGFLPFSQGGRPVGHQAGGAGRGHSESTAPAAAVWAQIEWIEHKGPKCIPAAAIQRAFLSGNQQVDIILVNHARVRAKLDEDCPALDFYGRFYLQPEDDRICAHRDAIHSRMGGSCMIEKFRKLVPKIRQG